MEKKTTRISDNRFGALNVEWGTRGGYTRKENGWAKDDRPQVLFVMPATPYRGEARLLNLDPQEALLLLDWLDAERPTLERLIEKKGEL